jgi:hypothetical protein
MRLDRGRPVSAMRAAAIGFIGIVALVACRAGERTTTPETGTPCGGTETTLEAARSAATYELVEPLAPTRSKGNLTSVWQCATVAGGYLLVYDSGIGVLESVNTLKDPPAEWQGLADSYKEFTVGEINGVPASFADPSVDGAIGGVDFVIGEVRYTVSGNGSLPLEDLIAIADSLPVDGSA